MNQHHLRSTIAQSVSSIFGPDDVERLVKMGVAEAVYVNYTHFDSGGILHTKMMVADETGALQLRAIHHTHTAHTSRAGSHPSMMAFGWW